MSFEDTIAIHDALTASYSGALSERLVGVQMSLTHLHFVSFAIFDEVAIGQYWLAGSNVGWRLLSWQVDD